MQYRFEERQRFKLRVYDIDDFERVEDLTKQDFLGELDFMLHEVVTQRNQTLKRQL